MAFMLPITDISHHPQTPNYESLRADKRRTGTSGAHLDNARKPKNIDELPIDRENDGA